MSAFVVSKNHITALVAVICNGPYDLADNSIRWRERMTWNGIVMRYPEQQDLDALGVLLWRENIDSMNARYRNAQYRDGVSDSDAGSYVFAQPDRRPTIIEALKLISCYEYQSCEHDGWPLSRAYNICKRLRAVLIEELPGYEAAPWAI